MRILFKRCTTPQNKPFFGLIFFLEGWGCTNKENIHTCTKIIEAMQFFCSKHRGHANLSVVQLVDSDGPRGGLVKRPTAQVVTWGSKNPHVDPQDLKGREKLTQPMANLTKLMGVPYLVGNIWKNHV